MHTFRASGFFVFFSITTNQQEVLNSLLVVGVAGHCLHAGTLCFGLVAAGALDHTVITAALVVRVVLGSLGTAHIALVPVPFFSAFVAVHNHFVTYNVIVIIARFDRVNRVLSSPL